MLQKKHTLNRGFVLKEHYTDTIFYQIELTARYCKLLGQQVFEEYNMGMSVDEFAILDICNSHKELCQRDLAKLILRDRANTGKLLDTLEGKNLITRKLSMKNNRPVKIIEITEEGAQKVEEVISKIRPHYRQVKEKIANSDLALVKDLLQDLRKMLNETVSIQI
jgi:DNA-binding MarR family transcriptional regulator